MKRVVLAANEVHNGWYFAAGDQVVIEGTVNGDAYVAGGVVRVDGTINGDLLVAGGMVSVGGTVSDDIRAAGGVLHFSGKVGKNVSVAGGVVTVEKSATIDGNLLAACGNIDVSGTVGKEAKFASGDAGITGTVKGNVDFTGEYLSVLHGAKLGGNVTARVKDRDEHNVDIADGTVKGKVEILSRDMQEVSRILGYRQGAFWFKVVLACSLLLTALVFALLFPGQLKDIGSTITEHPGQSLLWGILGLIVLPVITVVLFITVVGFPLGLFAVTVLLWTVYLAQLSLGVVLGHRIFGTQEKTGWNLFWGVAVGILIVQALTFVPYVRLLVNLASIIFGVGAILLVLRSQFQQLRTS